MTFETDLSVRRLGRAHGEAPTLFLLHGLTDSSAGWGRAVDHWGEDYSIVVVDQRGHGQSPRFTPEQLDGHPGHVLVDDAVALLDELDQAPVVIGHSLGGAVALEAAVRRPDLVRALVLEDPAPLGPDEEQRAPAKGRELADRVRDSLQARDHAELTEIRRSTHPTWRDDELLATGLAAQQTDLEFLARGEWKPSARWPGLFGELIVPALVVSGDALDEVCVDAEVEKTLADVGNPNLTLVRVKGAAHCIRREQPDRFYEVVDDWLTRH